MICDRLALLTLYPRYFVKINRGEVFPETPYPSQYAAEAGKSGVRAGANMYGQTQPEQVQQQLIRPVGMYGGSVPNVMPMGQAHAFSGGGGYSSGSSFTPSISGYGLYGAAPGVSVPVPPSR